MKLFKLLILTVLFTGCGNPYNFSGNANNEGPDTKGVPIAPPEQPEDPDTKVLICDNLPDHKTCVCHYPNGDERKRRTLIIDKNGLEGHLDDDHHGRDEDTLGPCPEDAGA